MSKKNKNIPTETEMNSNEIMNEAQEIILEAALIAEDAEVESEELLDQSEEIIFETEDLGLLDVETEASLFLQEEEATEGFLPEASEEILLDDEETMNKDLELAGTELDSFEAAEIEDVEFVDEDRLESILESILFASDRPVSLASIKLVFKGTNIRTHHLKRALDQLAVEYAGGRRGITLEEAPGGYQLKTKIDNLDFLKRTLKSRPFRLSGPALEVLSIAAYKQPVVKAEIDEIRGVESGHLLRALMERGLVNFEGKSELPGRPMQYGTTKKFLEIFGLRNLKELPTLSQIDELLPEGMDAEQAEEKPTLSQITDSMSETMITSYSQGEDELMKIQEQLEEITTTTDFFEQEKLRQKQKRDEDKAQNIREALMLGEEVPTRDKNWLKRFDEALAAGENPSVAIETQEETLSAEPTTEADVQVLNESENSLEKAIHDFENDLDEPMYADSEADDEDELPYSADDEEVEGH